MYAVLEPGFKSFVLESIQRGEDKEGVCVWGVCVCVCVCVVCVCVCVCVCVRAQVNEETGNRRPVMLTLQRAPRAPKPSKAGISTDKEEGERERAKTEDT